MKASRRRGPLERQHKAAFSSYRRGDTDSDIASTCGVTRRAVAFWRKRHGLPRVMVNGRKYSIARWHYRLEFLIREGRTARYCAEILSKRLKTVQNTMSLIKRQELRAKESA